ncbi:MAG: Sua5/YciO/YrdC/YwlC family protein, partial [Desulfurococcaceae archaeon]
AYTPLHYLLHMNTRDKFLIMTSGNIAGEPMCIDEECAKGKLSKIVDYFLTHDREIVNRVDDSVIRKTGDNYLMLRRSRGYAPSWITTRVDLGGEYIAFGADNSNAGAVGFEDKVVLTQFIGDMETPATHRDLLKYIDFFTRNYRIGERLKPLVVVDMHPRLFSRIIGLEYAKSRSLQWVEVQHHYAHVLGAAADNELEGNIAGLAIDGVGWGLDGTIWGGEVLTFSADSYGFKRVASILPLPLTSDRDAYFPLRLVYAHYSLRGLDFNEIQKLVGADGSNGSKELLDTKYAYSLVKRGKYIPASSTGRLIDLVAAALDPQIKRTFEGEPAIWLESIAYRGDLVAVDNYRVVDRDGIHQLDYTGLVDWVFENKFKLSKPTLAKSFLYALGVALGETLAEATKGYRVSEIVASGGAIVNNFIYMGIRDKLLEHSLTPRLPQRIPPSDGGIALGQVIAASLKAVD